MIFEFLSWHERIERRCERRKIWRRWFAWRPARLDDRRIIWLGHVRRKAEFSNGTGPWIYKVEREAVLDRLTGEEA